MEKSKTNKRVILGENERKKPKKKLLLCILFRTMKRRKAAEVCVGGQRPRKKPKEGDNNMEFWKKISAAQRSDFLSSVQVC